MRLIDFVYHSSLGLGVIKKKSHSHGAGPARRALVDIREHHLCCCSEQLLYRDVQRFRGGLEFKAHRHLYHPTLGLRVRRRREVRAFC